MLDVALPEVPEAPVAEAPKVKTKETRNRKPRMTPPQGGFTSFPVEGFSDEKYSYPVKEDFSEEGPYYEEFKLSQLNDQIRLLKEKRNEFQAEIDIWKEAGGDKALVDQRRGSLKTRNKLAAAISSKSISAKDLESLKALLLEKGLL